MASPPADSQPRDPLLAAFGGRVRALREGKGLKPAELARALGISQASLWRLEDGQQNPTLRSLSRLGLAFGMPMAALLEGIDPDPSTRGTRRYRKVGAGEDRG